MTIGAEAPEIALENPDGEVIQFELPYEGSMFYLTFGLPGADHVGQKIQISLELTISIKVKTLKFAGFAWIKTREAWLGRN